MAHFLIVNDDGIDSPLLQALIESFQKLGEVTVAAPRHEQSWVSKCMSRFKAVDFIERDDLPCRAFSIAGSPADCVNLALGYLCETPPTAVVSGINVGHNAGLAYILSSGTVGAALEGALHAIPSFAASMGLARDDYDRLKGDPQALGQTLGLKARQAADILADFVGSTLARNENPYGIVHSLNFPSTPLDNAVIVPSRPALTQAASFFGNISGEYRFQYVELPEAAAVDSSDRNTLKSGHISYSRLDFAALGQIIST